MNTATKRRWAMAAIALVAGGLMIYVLHPVLVPLLIALVFAYLLDPVVESLAARRVPRPVSSISIMALATGILIAILLWLIPAIGREIQAALADLPRYSKQIATYAKPYIDRIDQVYPGGVESLTQKGIETARANAPKMMAPLATVVAQTFSSIVNLILGLLNLILIPIMTYFLLRDIQKLRSRFYELIPPRRRKGVQELLKEIERVLNAFVRGQLTVCTILAVMYGIGLSLLGVPMALFWALLGGYGNLIPYVGTLTSASGAMLFSFMHHHDLKLMVMTGGVFVLAQTLEGTLIGPRIVGDSVGLNPVIVMLAVITGGNLFGFVGMLLAVPTVAVGAVLVKHAYARYVKSEFYKAH